MPRNYVRKEGARPYNSTKGKDVDGAIEEVRKGRSVREVARDFGIHYSTLQRRINGKNLLL